MKLKYSFDAVDMGDEIVCVPVGEGSEQIHGIVKMNKSGQEIMELLKDETTVEKMVEQLADKYENDRENLESEVLRIIDILRNANILDE